MSTSAISLDAERLGREAKFRRVSYERILSGRSLREICEFLRERSDGEEPPWFTHEFAEEPAPVVVVRNALNGRSELCLGPSTFSRRSMRPKLGTSRSK